MSFFSEVFWSVYPALLKSVDILPFESLCQVENYVPDRFRAVGKNLLKNTLRVFLLPLLFFFCLNLFKHVKKETPGWSFQSETKDQHLVLQLATDKIQICNTSFSRVLTPWEVNGRPSENKTPQCRAGKKYIDTSFAPTCYNGVKVTSPAPIRLFNLLGINQSTLGLIIT